MNYKIWVYGFVTKIDFNLPVDKFLFLHYTRAALNFEPSVSYLILLDNIQLHFTLQNPISYSRRAKKTHLHTKIFDWVIATRRIHLYVNTSHENEPIQNSTIKKQHREKRNTCHTTLTGNTTMPHTSRVHNKNIYFTSSWLRTYMQ